MPIKINSLEILGFSSSGGSRIRNTGSSKVIYFFIGVQILENTNIFLDQMNLNLNISWGMGLIGINNIFCCVYVPRVRGLVLTTPREEVRASTGHGDR
jgi:hypothetical protein